MKKYFIRDYTNHKNLPELRIAYGDDIFVELARAYKDRMVKIAVYEIGRCILDWSEGSGEKGNGEAVEELDNATS